MTPYEPLALFRCEPCDFSFQPTMATDEVRAAYDAAYFDRYGTDGNSYTFSEDQRRHEARVRLSFIEPFIARPGRLLEIGSATGFFLAESHKAGWEATGIEPCEPVAREAAANVGTKTILGFVEDVELDPGAYDLVCGWHVLEHIPRPLKPLRKLRDALRPEGYIMFEVPNFGGALSKQQGPRWQHLDPAHHVAQFTAKSLRLLLEGAGFHVVTTTSIPMFDYLPWRLGLHPRQLMRRGRYAMSTRSTGFGSHPDKFELLRIVGQPSRASENPN